MDAVRIGAGSMRDGAAALVLLAAAIEAAQVTARTAERIAEPALQEIASSRANLAALDGGDSPAARRVAERLERATDELADAQAMSREAMTAASDAARRFVAAMDQATERAKAPPDPPEPGAGPRENPIQFLYRQAGDILGDQFNPRAASNPLSGGVNSVGQGVGLVFGWAESLGEGHFRNATTYEPGYWAEPPRWVAGHWRRTPSGGRIWVNGYQRSPGVWVPARRVADFERRAVAASRARFLRRGGGVLGGIIAGAGQWSEDRVRPDLNTRERLARLVTSSVLVGGSAYGGAALGAALLTPEAPGVGTVVGAFVGGLVGGTLGSGIGEKLEGPAFKAARIDG